MPEYFNLMLTLSDNFILNSKLVFVQTKSPPVVNMILKPPADFITAFTYKRVAALICESGYEVCRRLKNHIYHRRTLCLNEERFTVEDEIAGKGAHHIEIFWHFHPQLTLKKKDEFWIVFHERLKKDIGKISIESMDEIFTEPATYHPEFGLSLNNTKLVGRKKGNLPIRITTQFLFDK